MSPPIKFPRANTVDPDGYDTRFASLETRVALVEEGFSDSKKFRDRLIFACIGLIATVIGSWISTQVSIARIETRLELWQPSISSPGVQSRQHSPTP